MPDADDRDLLARHAAGDPTAFSGLYHKYYPRVFGFCTRMVGRREVVDDIVQNVFTRAYETVQALESPELFSYWLFTIARNEVYANFRATSRRGTVSLEEDISDPMTPFDQTIQHERARLVEEGIKHLKPEYREVIILRQFEGLSYAEIAAVTGNTVSSVESRLFKARRALLKLLQPALGVSEES